MLKNKRITNSDLKTVHKLKNAGLSNLEISKITGRGTGTIFYLSKANSLEEYKQVSKRGKQTKPVAKKPEANKPAQPSNDLQELTKEVRRCANALEILSKNKN